MIYIYIIQPKIPQVNSKIRSNGKFKGFKGLIENDRTYTIDDCFCLYHNTKPPQLNYGGFISIFIHSPKP